MTHRYYKVVSGPILAMLKEFTETVRKNILEVRMFSARVGADRVMWGSGGIRAFGFDDKIKVPKGWIQAKNSEGYLPGKRAVDQEAILAECARHRRATSHDLQNKVTGNDSFCTYYNKDGAISTMGFETIGKTYVLAVPYTEEGFVDWEKDKGDSLDKPMTLEPWPIPKKGLKLLKMSEYHAMKEAEEEKTKKK